MLTDTKCRTAKPKEKLYRINEFNGLYLKMKPNGKSMAIPFSTKWKIKHACIRSLPINNTS